MTADIWVKDGMDDEYIGPTSQVETPVHYEEKGHGKDDGCRMCLKAAITVGKNVINTSYVAQGIRHEHRYLASFEGD